MGFQSQPQRRLLHKPTGPLHRVPVEPPARRLLLVPPRHHIFVFFPRHRLRHLDKTPRAVHHLARRECGAVAARVVDPDRRLQSGRARHVHLAHPPLGCEASFLAPVPPPVVPARAKNLRHDPATGPADGPVQHQAGDGPRRPVHLPSGEQPRDRSWRREDQNRLDVGVL